jgi:exodeoxyribonuclease-3
MMSVIRVMTWNINSVRLRLPLLLAVLTQHQPDVVALQEIKCATELFPAQALHDAGYIHQHVVGMKAYNGVAILSRIPFTSSDSLKWCGRDDARHAQVTLHNGLTLHNFYVPAGGDIPDISLNEKFAHKLQFLEEMAAWSCQTAPQKSIVVGDLNVAPLPDDVWSHKQMLRVVSHTPEEVERFDAIMQTANWQDAARLITPPPEKLYSWWSYRAQDWAQSNRGRRLDHIWLSEDIRQHLQGVGFHSVWRGSEQPSDHIPLTVDLAFSL